jgi:hypothetical protein
LTESALRTVAPPPEEVEAQGGERAEEDVLVPQGPHILDLMMLVYLPIPHDQDEGLAGRRAPVRKGEGDKVGQLGDTAALAPQDHEIA